MISGFVFEFKYPNINLKKQIFKLLKMIILSNLLFFIWGVLYYCCYLETMSFKEFLLYLTDGENWYKKIIGYLFYHKVLVYKAYHLWYLNALLYTWIIVFVSRRLFGEKGMKVLYFMTPLLLIYAVAHSNYATILFGYFKEEETRNFLFCGIPYFCIGSWINKKRRYFDLAFSKKVYFVCLLAFCLLVCLEEYILLNVRTAKMGDYFIGTACQAIALFLLFKKINMSKSKSKLMKLLVYIGKKHSTFIYLMHPIFHLVIWNILGVLNVQYIYKK